MDEKVGINNHNPGAIFGGLENFGLPGIGFWEYDVERNSYVCSAESCALRGLPSCAVVQEYTPIEMVRSVHYADRRRVEAAVERLRLGQHKRLSIRYRIWCNKAHWCWIMTRASITHAASDNQPLRIAGVDIDVAEIYEELPENKLLREEAERSEIALASAEQGLWHVDFRHGRRTQNNTWRTMRGYPADSDYSPSTTWKQDIHPDDFELVLNQSHICSHMETDTVDYAYRQRHANGEWQWIWSRGKIIERDSDNQPLVLIGTDTDITKFKEAQTRFERMSNTLEIAAQTAGMGVWEWSLNSTVNVWDRRTREIFGTKLDEELVSCDTFLARVHPDDRERLVLECDKAIASHSDINANYRINHPEHGIRYITTKATCNYAVGEVPRYVGIVRDVTARVLAEREREHLVENLSHAQRLQSLGELTGGIAHDFNNLMAIISGNAELMSRAMSEDSHFLGAITNASKRGAELTQSLLAFSRKQALQPVSVDLRLLAANLQNMLGRTLGSTLQLRTHVPDDLWNCWADPAQLENALINLVVNARDSMPGGGSISINFANSVVDESFSSLTQQTKAGHFVRVSVVDSGSGMSKQVLETSIDPFYTTKSAGDGHGLGLSMVFGFVKQSDGHMTISSDVGEGTTVSLYLPQHDEHEQTEQRECDKSLDLLKGHGETILLVEDEPSVQRMVEDFARHLGYGIVCAGSAQEALKQLAEKSQKIDLIVSDILLSGGMNGLELGNEVSKLFPELEILYMSGYARDALDAIGLSSASVEVLQKPFSMQVLASKIAQRLETR